LSTAAIFYALDAIDRLLLRLLLAVLGYCPANNQSDFAVIDITRISIFFMHEA
jgi:hypothetical protein